MVWVAFGSCSSNNSSNKVNPELKRVLEAKRAFRQRLAARPVAEKLRMLDALRERSLTIRRASRPTKKVIVEETPPLPQLTDPG
jgi:hypothetical protein